MRNVVIACSLFVASTACSSTQDPQEPIPLADDQGAGVQPVFLPKDDGSNKASAEFEEAVKIQISVVTPGEKLGPKGDREYRPDTDSHFTYGDDRQIAISIQGRTYTTIEEARDRLFELGQLAADELGPVQIDPRKGVVYAEVTKTLDAVLQAGFTEVAFAGSYEE